MATSRLASTSSWLFCCATFLAFTLPDGIRGEDSTASPPPKVTVELWVAELSVPAMRGYGIDPNIPYGTRTVRLDEMFLSPDEMHPLVARDLVRFLDYLRDRDVARVLAEPKLTTLSGREASLVVGDDKLGGTKLDVTPVVKDDGKIRVQYRVEIRKPSRAPGGRSAPPGQQVLTCCCAVDAESGNAVLGAPAIPWDADGKTSPDKIVIVVLRATAGTSSPDQSPSVVAASDGELRR